MFKILAINPGSTSTKIGVFEDHTQLFEKVLRHSTEELAKYERVADQFEFRKAEILKALDENNIIIHSLSAVACRGGVTKPITGGTYLVTDEVCEFQRTTPYEHPANLAAIIGKRIADEVGINAYFVDSPMTYELNELASFSGHKEIKRPGRFHALNQKAIARQFAKDQGKKYDELNVIVCHLGGGISVGAHEKGLVVDVNDAGEEGAFTPERTGSLPVRHVIDLCFSGKYTHSEMKKFIQGNGGLNSYLGMNDCREIENRASYDPEARKVLEAMSYQVAKEIGANATVLNGQVDAIILTGGIAYSEMITNFIKERVSFIADVYIYPGEKELEALAEGAIRVLTNEETPKIVELYPKEEKTLVTV
ncbi:butyrate kinase [Bacillus massiliigorillae]|uniref:butyrate kinase n=1 Tax=Bacillus massiliigorillae TaxID=1243664 RepID=UPI0003A03383|nr:butyrate kinase [Bacillus massiliigorillae]